MQLLASSHSVFSLVSSVKEGRCLVGKQIHLFSFFLSPPVLYLSASVGGSQFVVNVHSQFLQILTFVFKRQNISRCPSHQVTLTLHQTSITKNTEFRDFASQGKTMILMGTKHIFLRENVKI